MFNCRYIPAAFVINSVLRSFLNMSRSSCLRIQIGRLFHSLGPAQEKALFPYPDKKSFSTTFNVLTFDTATISVNASGAEPHTHLCMIRHSLKRILSCILNQCNLLYSGVSGIRSYLRFPSINLIAAFCTDCSSASSFLFIP